MAKQLQNASKEAAKLALKYNNYFQSHWELPIRLDKYLMMFNGLNKKNCQ